MTTFPSRDARKLLPKALRLPYFGGRAPTLSDRAPNYPVRKLVAIHFFNFRKAKEPSMTDNTGMRHR
ncbi:g3317 [Coccomyxa viridis]|uniref:G3317 protein n=1 Tax=Coccomyxa viridis TaxID=1274662 RepID=A0ABP1FPT8_9CHLO